jgi:lysyl-tRNA synthetase class 2
MPSRVIRWFRYRPEQRELLIGFQSGREYAYLEVPEPVYLAMRRAFAKGEFFNAHIRNHFTCVPRGDP